MKQTQKHTLTPNNVRKVLNFYRERGEPFEMAVQTYSTQIYTEDKSVKHLFMNKSQSRSMFVAYQKIKKDVAEFDRKLGKLIPEILFPVYNEHKFTKDENFPVVWNFDINSAYLCALKQTGIISEDTYIYCQGLSKPDRLACVGMLASRKTIFAYDENGNISDVWEEKSDYYKYFFWAVNYIGEAMSDTMRFIELKDIFLFFWVDGIYCVPCQPEELFESFIFANLKRDFGLDIKLEKLNNFRVKKINETFDVRYYKDTKEKRFLFKKDDKLNKIKSDILKMAYNDRPRD